MLSLALPDQTSANVGASESCEQIAPNFINQQNDEGDVYLVLRDRAKREKEEACIICLNITNEKNFTPQHIGLLLNQSHDEKDFKSWKHLSNLVTAACKKTSITQGLIVTTAQPYVED